jgi:hypothetical protein
VSGTPRQGRGAALTDVLERTVSGRIEVHELARLPPRAWKAEQPTAAVGA